MSKMATIPSVQRACVRSSRPTPREFRCRSLLSRLRQGRTSPRHRAVGALPRTALLLRHVQAAGVPVPPADERRHCTRKPIGVVPTRDSAIAPLTGRLGAYCRCSRKHDDLRISTKNPRPLPDVPSWAGRFADYTSFPSLAGLPDSAGLPAVASPARPGSPRLPCSCGRRSRCRRRRRWSSGCRRWTGNGSTPCRPAP